MSDEVRLHPPWREAVTQFVAACFGYEEVVPWAWFYEAFGVEMPGPDTPNQQAQRLELAFLAQFKPFQRELLEAYQLDLVNERGIGYRIVPPGEQTTLAYGDGVATIRKELRRMANRILHVNHGLLTAEQRRENAEAIAALARLREIQKEASRPKWRLPAPDEG